MCYVHKSLDRLCVMYILHCMLRTIGQVETGSGLGPLGGQIEGMRRRGMSATAIRRALGLNARQAMAAGILSPLPAASRRDMGTAAHARSAPKVAACGAGLPAPSAAPAAASRGGPAMSCVLAAVAEAAGTGAAHLLGPRQTRALARPRQLTMYLLRQHCVGASLPAIGHFMGRDHTTVLYGCRRAAELLARDAEFRDLHARALERLSETAHAQG